MHDEVIKNDSEAYNMIEKYNIDVKTIEGKRESVFSIVEDILERIGNV